ncbi:MAG: hypothetical protein H0Z38_00840 [Firmicutes bacterium]|nr:hypothetical protein [Bacillota bacterium]
MPVKVKPALFIIVAGLLLLPIAAVAAPSLSGPTGLITIPSADVIQSDQFNIGGFMVEDELSFVINGAPIPGLEVGVGVHGRGDSLGYLNAKYQLVPETREYPGVAVGAVGINDVTRRSVYVVASKNLPEFGVRGHIGIQTPGDPLFAGVSKVLNTVSVQRPGEKSLALQTTLLAELRGSDPSVGLRLRLSPHFVLHASYVDLSTGVIGLSYNGWF